MGDSALFVGFGQPVRGREQQAVGVFGEAIGLYQQLQERGEIESFEPTFLEPHGGDLGGFFMLRGEEEKLARVRMSEEFERLSTRAGLVVEGFGVIGATTGEGVDRLMTLYQAQLAELGSGIEAHA
jgi:hypothetical protein